MVETSNMPQGLPDRDEQIANLAEAIDAFSRVPAAALRRKVIAWFFGLCGLVAVALATLGLWPLGLGVIGFGLLCGLCYLAVNGIGGKTYLAHKGGCFLRGGSMADWVIWVFGAVLLVVVLVVFDLLSAAIAMLAVVLVLAFAVHLKLDWKVVAERQGPIELVEQTLKDLRRQGTDEEALRRFVCEHGGQDWEPFFEALFGYEAMIDARRLWGLDELGRPRRRHLVWRDRIVNWLDDRIKARDTRPDSQRRRESQQVEEKPLPSAPPPRSHESEPLQNKTPPQEARPSLLADPRTRRDIELSLRSVRHQTFFTLILGPRVRFVLGVLLIAGCLYWMVQNDLMPHKRIQDLGRQLAGDNGVENIDEATKSPVERIGEAHKQTRPLEFPLLPSALTRWFDTYNAGLAGLILVFTSFFGGIRIAPFVFAAAVTVMFGHHWSIPSGGILSSQFATRGVGLVLTAMGICFHLITAMAARTNILGGANEGQVVLLNARGEVLHSTRGRSSLQQSTALRFFRTMLLCAFRARASDIHFEPQRDGGAVRIRVDGSMIDVTRMGRDLFPRLLSLVKVLCDLDITKRRIVQEGHFRAAMPGRTVDYRTSFAPAVHGQTLVLRALDAASVPCHLHELMLPEAMRAEIRNICTQSTGMLLACGPTGSGKTTTVYAVLRDIDVKKCHVITIEDPIEYQIEGATQIPVDAQAGNTFGSLLRSVLRQDPDVILLGEIRDSQTARTALQAAVTGHLVLSTLHAKDTVAALLRLLDLGVEPNLLASSLRLVLVQRLIRLLCNRCKVVRTATAQELERMGRYGQDPVKVYDASGCRKCLNAGYVGRRALFEPLVVNDAVQEAILRSPTASGLRDVIARSGFVGLAQMAWQAVAEGVTSIDEVERVTGES